MTLLLESLGTEIVRIPLDYYRVLGLPIQATDEQLKQAHRDRGLQLPRREYSEAAIAARKDLIDEAYAIIANPEERQAYDAGFLARTYGVNAALLGEGDDADAATPDTAIAQASTDAESALTPTIEIDPDQLIGALVILQELGEYELVIRLGRPYLSSGNQVLSGGRYGEPADIFPDLVLTVALACLELGREQWQQGRYENAAESLETGRELLERERLFESLRAEIQSDLYKLRPYQVLELLALPETRLNQRHKGLQMLQAMLQERGGIDGQGDDRSGLDIDNFLRFIQQLRSYLTAAEQQTLFEAEARRPSAVANYLAVYALLARGFAQKQPNWIRRAKQMLGRLSDRQDVHLEQAVCALLLGQTEAASHALELSQEYEPLAFIREHSQGSTDLLPGLCLYAERWLQQEVFPHFRDLANQSASLRHYFADEHVQAYLEALPAQDVEMTANLTPPPTPTMPTWQTPPPVADPVAEDIRDWRTRELSAPTTTSAAFSPPLPRGSAPTHYPPIPADDALSPASPASAFVPPAASSVTASSGAEDYTYPESPAAQFDRDEEVAPDQVYMGNVGSVGIESTLAPDYPDYAAAVASTAATVPASIAPSTSSHPSLEPATSPTAAYVARLSPDGQLTPGRRTRQSSPSAARPEPAAVATRTRSPQAPVATRTRSRQPGQRRGSSLRVGRLSLVIVGFLLAIGGLGFGMSRLIKGLSALGPAPTESTEQLAIGLDELPLTIPESTLIAASSQPVTALTAAEAEATIQAWFGAKQSAFGSTYNLDALDPVLTEPLLGQKRDRAALAQQEGWYWDYSHEVMTVDLLPSDTPATTATVEAEVREAGDYYRNGTLVEGESYDSVLTVQYNLVNTPEGWRIQDMAVQ